MKDWHSEDFEDDKPIDRLEDIVSRSRAETKTNLMEVDVIDLVREVKTIRIEIQHLERLVEAKNKLIKGQAELLGQALRLGPVA